MALQTATNKATGERVVLVGSEWKPITQSATNKQGAKAYLVGDKWLTEDAPTQQPAAPVSEIPAGRTTLQEVFQFGGNLAAGALRGAGEIGAGINRVRGMMGLPFGDTAEESAQRRAAMDAALKSFGAEPESMAYGGTKFVTEVAGTAGLGGVLAKPVMAAAKYAPAAAEYLSPIATSLESGGFKTGIEGAGKLANIGARTVGGAGVGAGTAAMLSPDDIGTGAGLGAGIAVVAPPVVGTLITAGKKLGTHAADVFNPQRLKASGLANALENNTALMQQVKSLLEQGKTIQEAAAITNSSGLAAYARSSRDANAATQRIYRELDDAIKASQVNQLAGAQQNLNALTQQNIPVATASPTAPRRAVKQALAGEAAELQAKQAALTGQLTAEQQAREMALQGRQAAMTGQLTAEQQAAQAALAAKRKGVEGGIANVSQLETGRALAKSVDAVEEVTKKTVTSPAYNKAFELAPDPTINLGDLAGVAKGQLGEVLTQIKGLAPNASVLLERYGPKQIEVMVQGFPVKTIQQAKPVTLQEADAIRKAINIDLAALKGSQESGANFARSHLMQLKTALDSSISKGAPEEAVKAYAAANSLFKERIVDVFRTGQVANIGRTSTLNQPMLRPGDIVNKAMADEGETLQFLKVFKQDPAAMQNLKTGVEDLYRQQVLSGGKAATPAAHAKFMFDNAKQLGALDSAGLGMSERLNQIGGQIKKLSAADEAIAAQGKAIPSKVSEVIKPEFEAIAAQAKAIPGKVAETFKAEDEALKLASKTIGFGQTDKLRAAIVSNPEVAGQALTRMDAGAKSSLARGVMQDAGKAADPLKHLVDNEVGIMRVLRANDPKTAKATFEAAKESAELSKIIGEVGNKLGVEPAKNAMATNQNLERLTAGRPDVRAIVDDIKTQLALGKKFDELASEGAKTGESALRLFKDETTPRSSLLNRAWTLANMILARVDKKIDKKLAVEIAMELSNSDLAAKSVGKALVRQSALNASKAGTERTVNALGKVAAPATLATMNSLSREK